MPNPPKRGAICGFQKIICIVFREYATKWRSGSPRMGEVSDGEVVWGESRYPVDRDWNDCYPAPGPGTIPYDPVKTKRDFFCFNTPAPHTEHGYVIGQEMGGFFMAFSVQSSSLIPYQTQLLLLRDWTDG